MCQHTEERLVASALRSQGAARDGARGAVTHRPALALGGETAAASSQLDSGHDEAPMGTTCMSLKAESASGAHQELMATGNTRTLPRTHKFDAFLRWLVVTLSLRSVSQ